MHETTRRRFIQTVSGLAAVTPAAIARAATRQRGPSRRVLLYVGTYSSPQASGRGQGIHLLEMDPASGALTARDVLETAANPSWLVLNHARTHLYSANEAATPGTGAGSVTAYSIDRATG